MRTVYPDRELNLEQQLVCRAPEAVRRAPVLGAHLTELAWPERDHRRPSTIDHVGARGSSGSVIPPAGKPASGELVVGRHVVAKRVLRRIELVAPAPYHLGAPDERAVPRAPQ